MQVLIDIPEEQYLTLNAEKQEDIATVIDDRLLIRAIKEGVVLPANHGRLIDGDYLEQRLRRSAEYWRDTDSIREERFGKGISAAADAIGDSDTIVEAQNIGEPVERKYKLIEYYKA